MRRFLQVWLSATIILFHATAFSKEIDNTLPPLQFGLLPYLSVHQLIKNYLPLKNYLEEKLGRTIVMTTAPDYRSHLLRIRDNVYDFYLTAPHMAALAEHDWQAQRLAGYKRRLEGSLVVAKNSPYRKIADIRGKIIAAPGPYAIVTVLAESLLESHHLIPGENIIITASHNNSLLAVIRGNADAAIISSSVFGQQEYKQQLRLLGTTQSVPHTMFMARAHINESDYLAIRDAFMHFTADGPGKLFFEHTGYVDMVSITDAQMRELAPFAETLRHLLYGEYD